MSSFWEHRPFWLGGEWDLPDTGEELNYDIWWHIAGASAMHAWMHFTRLGVPINLALGEIFFPPKPFAYSRSLSHARGASPGFIQGAGQMAVRAAPAVGIGAAVVAASVAVIWLVHTIQLHFNIQKK